MRRDGSAARIGTSHAGGWHNGVVSIRVFLLDDHELVREGIRQLLESDEEIDVVGEATTAAEALVRIPLANPDVAILDVRLEDGSGIEVCRDMRSALPDLVCLMLTSYADDEALYASVMAGASSMSSPAPRGMCSSASAPGSSLRM
jgi:two-component system response regulator DevR